MLYVVYFKTKWEHHFIDKSKYIHEMKKELLNFSLFKILFYTLIIIVYFGFGLYCRLNMLLLFIILSQLCFTAGQTPLPSSSFGPRLWAAYDQFLKWSQNHTAITNEVCGISKDHM